MHRDQFCLEILPWGKKQIHSFTNSVHAKAWGRYQGSGHKFLENLGTTFFFPRDCNDSYVYFTMAGMLYADVISKPAFRVENCPWLKLHLSSPSYMSKFSIIPLCSSAHPIAVYPPQITGWSIREAASPPQLDPRLSRFTEQKGSHFLILPAVLI